MSGASSTLQVGTAQARDSIPDGSGSVALESAKNKSVRTAVDPMYEMHQPCRQVATFGSNGLWIIVPCYFLYWLTSCLSVSNVDGVFFVPRAPNRRYYRLSSLIAIKKGGELTLFLRLAVVCEGDAGFSKIRGLQ